MKDKIFPRNLTAHLSHNVAGNPAVTRLESSVGNCFPGLEMDIRNLDRRFFPGLLFYYVGGPDAGLTQNNQQGVKLLYVNTEPEQEPMLPESATEEWQQKLLSDLNGDKGALLADDGWYLHSIAQGGNRIELYQFAYYENSTQRIPYEAETVWWLVRGLSPDEPVTIELIQRDDRGAFISPPVELTGYRRRYLNDDGSLNEIFRPGEMTESLCSPWTHDFRDCACHYWAASHPDVVLGAAEANTLPGGASRDPVTATTYLDWLRSDRGPSGRSESAPTITEQRPLRIDHYEINSTWEELSFVIEGREIPDMPGAPPKGGVVTLPYSDLEEMIHELETHLAPLELTLAVEYLYALFSLKTPEETVAGKWPTLHDDLGMIRQFITLVAVGEMQHLRWANQLLWSLYKYRKSGKKKYKPVFRYANNLPDGSKPQLERLEPAVLDRFINYERPEGEIFRCYSRCVATLGHQDLKIPEQLYELAIRIDSDGMEHFTRFRDIKTVLQAYADADGFPFLRDVKTGRLKDTKQAENLFTGILADLSQAYTLEANGKPAASQDCINKARTKMHNLYDEGEKLARRGIGIPFLQFKLK